MKPIKIEFQAFGPYPDYEVVDFEDMSRKGLFLICGKTGSGKTMILDAMTFALFGKSSGHVRDSLEAMRSTNADFDKTTYVRFIFEDNQKIYKFERRLVRKRKNLSAEYSAEIKKEDGTWEVMFENPKEKDLNQRAEEIIGLDYEQFRQVIILPQGQFEKLLVSNSDEKEKILANIFGEMQWQKIADRMVERTAKVRDELKLKKLKVSEKLKEEGCETTEDLRNLISEKQEVLNQLEEEFIKNNYDELINKQQKLAALAKRFEDMNKAALRLEQYEAQAVDKEKWIRSINDALRANKVMVLLEKAKESHILLEKRRAEEERAQRSADIMKTEADTASEKLKELLEGISLIDNKKTIKLQYKNKYADYEGMDAVKLQYAEKQKEENSAIKTEQAFKEKYEAYDEKIIKDRNNYEKLNKEHQLLLDKYVNGIAGELAKNLEDNMPCPVCGSTVHPNKACIYDDSVTKEDVELKKQEVDSAYVVLQKLLSDKEEAKKVLDEKHSVTENIRVEVAGIKIRLESLQKNMVEGIGSLKELQKAVEELKNDIDEYEKMKSVFEKEAQDKKEKYTIALAKIEPAKRETENANKDYETALSLADEVLKSEGFKDADEVNNLYKSVEEIDILKDMVSKFDSGIKMARENLEELKKELEGKEEPDEEECLRKIKEATDAKSDYAEKKGILNSNKERLEAKLSEIEAESHGIEERYHQAEEDCIFAKSVRGDAGTGLQRYVLGIMFSSVIAAANKMLATVHGGRYHLYRSDEKNQGSNKRGLELKVTDSRSLDHEGRFVNTLSGGEKFLVSLSLAIGLSAIAKKSGIKIEALFIDEGFGSLDEESISDAMNVLNSIGEANGIVGIISHVQLLQDRIPTKLQVEKNASGSHIVKTIG